MEKQLFEDLLQSVREMVAIRKGEIPLSVVKTHTIEVPDETLAKPTQKQNDKHSASTTPYGRPLDE